MKNKTFECLCYGKRVKIFYADIISILSNQDIFNKLLFDYDSYQSSLFNDYPFDLWRNAIEFYTFNLSKEDNPIIRGNFQRFQSRAIDYEPFQIIYNTEGHLLPKEFILDKELEEKIIENIPMFFNSIEKAIFIYYRLCKELSFDEYFFLNQNKKREMVKKYKEFREISLKKSDVICIEFIRAFVAILNKLSINAVIIGEEPKRTIVHQFARVIEDGYIIDFEPTQGVFKADICGIKFGKEFNGIIENNGQSISRYIRNVLEFIDEEDKRKIEEFDSLRSYYYYEAYCSKTGREDFLTRLNEYLNLLNKTKGMKNIDSISYAINLLDLMFSEEELKSISKSYIRVKANPDRLAIIISFDNYSSDQIICFPMNDHEVKIVSKQEINSWFIDNEISYISQRNKTKGVGKVYGLFKKN